MFWRPTTSFRKSKAAEPITRRGFESQPSAILLSTLAIFTMCCCYCLSAQQPQPPRAITEEPDVIPFPLGEHAPLSVIEEAEVAQVSYPVQNLDPLTDRDSADKVELKVTRSAPQYQWSTSLDQRTMTRGALFRSTEFSSGYAKPASASMDKRSTMQPPERIAVRKYALKPTHPSFRTRRFSSKAQGLSYEGPKTSLKGSISSFLGSASSIKGSRSSFKGSRSTFKGSRSSFKSSRSLFKGPRSRKPSSSSNRVIEMFNTSLDYLHLLEVVTHPREPTTPRFIYNLPHRRKTSQSLDRVTRLEIDNRRSETPRKMRHRLRRRRHRLTPTSRAGSDGNDSVVFRISHFRCETGCRTDQKLQVGRHSNRQEVRRRVREHVIGLEPNANNRSASSTISLNSALSAVPCLLLDREMTLLFCSGQDLFLPNGSFSSNPSPAHSSSPICVFPSSSSSPFLFSTSSSSSSSSSSSPHLSQPWSSSSSFLFNRRIQLLAVLRPRFCDQLRGLDALDLDLVDSNCVLSLTSLVDADDQAAEIYGQFERLLGQFDCDDQYSVRWNCEDCKMAYRNWLCAIKLPVFYGVDRTKHLPACPVFSEMVEAKCPYLLPHSLMQYAGEPVFSSLSSGYELLQDGDCYYLCGDDIEKSLIKGAYSRNATDRICIHHGINQADSI